MSEAKAMTLHFQAVGEPAAVQHVVGPDDLILSAKQALYPSELQQGRRVRLVSYGRVLSDESKFSDYPFLADGTSILVSIAPASNGEADGQARTNPSMRSVSAHFSAGPSLIRAGELFREERRGEYPDGYPLGRHRAQASGAAPSQGLGLPDQQHEGRVPTSEPGLPFRALIAFVLGCKVGALWALWYLLRKEPSRPFILNTTLLLAFTAAMIIFLPFFLERTDPRARGMDAGAGLGGAPARGAAVAVGRAHGD